MKFEQPLDDQQKHALLNALIDSPYRGVRDSWAEIPAWERYLLSAKCSEVVGDDDALLGGVMFAVWSARIEACRPAAMKQASQQRVVTPLAERLSQGFLSMSIADAINEQEGEIERERIPAKQHELKLLAAMMCHRAGYTEKRDAFLAALRPPVAASPLLASRAKRFKELVAVETQAQERLIAILGKQLAEDDDNDAKGRHTVLMFQLADTLRRLGRKSESLEQFRAVRRRIKNPTDSLRMLTDHLLTVLAPGEPLPVPLLDEPEADAAEEALTPQANPVP
jgi:hypothetical protein